MISVMLPMRLPSTANLREHWAAKAKRTKAHRAAGRLAWQQLWRAGAVLPVQCWTPLVVTLTRLSPRQLDDDNLASAFKAFRDGLADGMKPHGVADDRDPRVRWVYAQERGEAAVRVGVLCESGDDARCVRRATMTRPEIDEAALIRAFATVRAARGTADELAALWVLVFGACWREADGAAPSTTTLAQSMLAALVNERFGEGLLPKVRYADEDAQNRKTS